MPHANFVPLRVFSSYTMLEGAIDPKVLAKHARKLGFPACAITDRNGLYGSMAFSEAAMGAGVQPVIGSLLAVARPGSGADCHPPVIDERTSTRLNSRPQYASRIQFTPVQ